ncbi:MAG: ABC transporter ATP-binding protein/permease [Lachnospiraceae bacterium]|nr:ABC transporter ATP-binding protein/permease [Lachnospiraceae bacterium]
MTIREMWHYILFQTKGYRTIKAAIVFGAMTAAAVPYVSSIFYAGILDRLVSGAYDRAAAAVVWMVCVVLALRLVASGCERIVSHYCEPCAFEIKKRTARKVFSMEYEALDRTESLEAFRRVRAGEQGNGGVERQLQQIFSFFQELAKIAYAACMVCVLFASTDSAKEDVAEAVFLAGLMFAMFAAVLALSHYFAGKEGAYNVETELKNEQINTLSAYLMNLINRETYVKDIRLFGLKQYLYGKTKYFQGVGRIFTECACYRGKCRAVPTFAAQMFAAVTYICIAAKAVAGSITIGEVTMYASAVIAMVSSVQELFAKYQDIRYRNEYLSAYEAFITRPDRQYDGTLPIEKRDDNAYLLEFSHVSFRYPGTTQDILKDVSLTFRVGEKLALVGANGAGKTTLIKLLCRLYEPTQGEIRLNGINIAKYDFDEYVRIFSVVFQDFRLYAFALDENVAAGEQVDEGQLRRAMELAGIWERIQELPQKQRTLYGHENGQGVLLSGGEAQKTAIARALYKNAPFIILDEPTAALDPLAEAEVYENFNTLIQNKTAIYISHRMSSCKFCDRIVVLGEGRILEEGNHETLMERQGTYYALYSAQAKYYTK